MATPRKNTKAPPKAEPKNDNTSITGAPRVVLPNGTVAVTR